MIHNRHLHQTMRKKRGRGVTATSCVAPPVCVVCCLLPPPPPFSHKINSSKCNSIHFFEARLAAPAAAAAAILGSSGSCRAMSVSSTTRISLVRTPSTRTTAWFRLLMMPTMMAVLPLSGPLRISTWRLSHAREGSKKDQHENVKHVCVCVRMMNENNIKTFCDVVRACVPACLPGL